ncbi:MAG: winged helix DNA-binding domain-containing protein [Actinomycetia bacterium]|nr:winged helix DNA-binding domain-containing protein [Actinomycetes bacterium]
MTPTLDLTASDALALRMASLQLAASDAVPVPDGVAGIVQWFGALQGQDLASLQWSLGLRLPGSTLADIEAALEAGEVLRTWPMRGTIHLVPAQDARWMLRVLGVKPLAGAAKRREYLGLSERDADRAVDLLGSALAGGGRLTRAECIDVLVAGGVDGAGQRGYHLLWYASQHGVTCIAPSVKGEQTFVLLDDWAPAPRDLSREEALSTIALRFFRSHGPATRKDFAGWTGLTVGDVKAGIAGCGDELVAVRVEGVEMVMAASLADVLPGSSGVAAAAVVPEWLALPGFDEYLLGFKDRSLVVDAAGMAAVIPGRNGVFRSTLGRDGRVVGTWKRVVGAKVVTVDVAPLLRLTMGEQRRAEEAWRPYAAFLGRSLDVQIRPTRAGTAASRAPSKGARPPTGSS